MVKQPKLGCRFERDGKLFKVIKQEVKGGITYSVNLRIK